jgi:hypothetical protein
LKIGNAIKALFDQFAAKAAALVSGFSQALAERPHFVAPDCVKRVCRGKKLNQPLGACDVVTGSPAMRLA